MQKNSLMMRALAFILLVSVLLSLIPSQTIAAIGTIKNNSLEQNQEILKFIKGIVGDDAKAQEILEMLNSLGLLDENGEFRLAKVNVDGQEMTLDEIRELVNSEGADLNKVVSVDGTYLTLGNLKVMIEIEDELQRIYSTYFRDITLNEEQQKALESINAQLAGEGIPLVSSFSSDTVQVPSGIDHTIRAMIDTSTLICENGSGTQSATVKLVDSKGNLLPKVPDYDISISYRFVDGGAQKDTNYIDTSGFNGTVNFTAGSTETQKNITFTINNDTSRFSGQKAFLIQFYDPRNIVLLDDNNGTEKDNMLAAEKVVLISKNYTWPTIDRDFHVTDNFRLNKYSTNLLLWGTTADTYIVPDDMIDIIKNYDIYNTVELGLTVQTNLNRLTLFATIGYDGYNLFMDSPSPIDYNYDLLRLDTDGPAQAYVTYKKTFGPENFDLRKLEKTGYYYDHGGCLYLASESPPYEVDYYCDRYIRFYDTVAPTVKSVTIPTSGVKYQYGQSIPVIVEFNEPVNMANVRMNVSTGGLEPRTLAPLEVGSAGTSKATFLYEVHQREESDDLTIINVTGAVDLSGNVQEEAYGGTTFNDVIDGLSKFYSFTTSTTASTKLDENGNTIVTAFLPISDNELTRWIAEPEIVYDETTGEMKLTTVYASIDGGTTPIPVYGVEDEGSGALTGLRCTFTAGLNISDTDVTQAVEFFYADDGTTFKNMVGKYATYNVPPVVFLEAGDIEISDNFPGDGVVFIQEGASFRLTYTLKKLATWNKPSDFEWTSSNTDVATINQDGVIVFTGQSTGAAPVVFTLTAKNGGIAGKAVSLTSAPLTVKVGLTPFLSIPEGTNTISVRSGESAEVRWTSNLIAKNAESGKDTKFTIEVFRAEYTGDVLSKGPSVHHQTVTGSETAPVSSYTIPASVLSGISLIGRYSYIVEVSAAHPYKAGETFKATAYISINAKPAVVKLNGLESYFLTDDRDLISIGWTLENFDTVNGSEFELEVTDNSDGRVIHRQTNTQDNGGSYILSVPKVSNGFRNVYTITVKAKNTLDPTWSYDSFVLYVYSNDALKIWIDGVEAGNTYTMSNREWISKLSSEDILILNREIYLKNVLSINFGDHTWGQLKDQIRWKSSDSSAASINFKDISIYNNIDNLSYSSYRPTDTFILSGLKDGMARITATHAGTNKTVSVDVQVDTLKDKLYLFQVSPKTKTTLTYTNGNGEKRTVETNDNGELALYEESGIKSEIHMKSSYGEKEYVGTLYKTVSSEKDYTRLELYPVNYFKLREISTAELYFIKPVDIFSFTGGIPLFSGDVILRGGVYKNGEYCADAKLNELPGTQDQIITIGKDGKFTVKLDPTQFWVNSSDEELNADDKLEFIFEVRFPGDEHYPRLLSINCNVGYEDAIKFGDKIVKVRKVSDENRYKPFIVTQYADYGFKSNVLLDVMNFTGRIGLGQTTEETVLTTTVFWWGEDINSDNEKHKLTLKDEHGIIPKWQTSSSLIYPFSSIKATRNTFVLNRNTMKGWLDSGESRAMYLMMTNADGSPYKEVSLPFSIINMVGVEKAEDSEDINDYYSKLSEVFKIKATGLDVADKVINGGLNFLWQVGLDSGITKDMFAVSLAPTADPSVFSVMVHLGFGNMEKDDNATGVYAEDDIAYDLDTTPGLFDMRDMYKGRYLEKSREKYKQNNAKRVSGEGSVLFTIGGYIEGELRYNDEKEKWEFYTTGGGFNAGGGYSYSWNYNTLVGPVPLTAQFTIGGSAEVIFKTTVLHGNMAWELYERDSVKHYLTTLRLYGYIRAFAGLGLDYSVIAAKIGLFGQISVDAQFAFLNRPEIFNGPHAGQKLTIGGKVGIEVVIKFLFVTHEHVLASTSFDIKSKTYNQWNTIHDLWDQITVNYDDTPDKTKRMLSAPMSSGSSAYPVSSIAVIERRDYLDSYERSWNEPVSKRGLLEATGISVDEVRYLETNSYPYSNPVLTDDGQILVYVSDADSTDVEKTEVRWTRLTAGGYPNGTAIETVPGGYGDSQVKLAGDQSFAAAAWVRQGRSINKEAGDPVTNADIVLMSNSTEIMAALYNGTDYWEAIQLTDNSTPDLAPAVATNGTKVMVAWRSVYAADSSNPLDFSGSDTIKYSIYDRTTGMWSEIQTLYNGTSGSVRGLEASMLEDGTSAVVYTISANDVIVSTPEMSPLETVYAVIDPNGNVIKNVRQTKDIYLDENPQITTVHFGDGQERFVLGWYSEHDADGVRINDIRLCAFDSNGVLYDVFIDSINSVNTNAVVNISRNFRFVNNAGTIEELSLLWTETENAHITEEDEVIPDRDLLKAVRFRSYNGFIYITAPLQVAEMDDYTLIDHFSVYNAGENTVKAVLLGTNYNNGYKEVAIEDEDGNVSTIQVPIAVSNLYTATGTYKNTIGVDYAAVDYTSVIRGMRIPVQFSVYNSGVDIIDSLTLEIGGNVAVYDKDFTLLPNESRILTVNYDIPYEKLVNPAYSITAGFANGETYIVNDTLYLDIPDIGISQLNCISNEDGKRVAEVTLYNSSDSILYGSFRRVRIGFYSDEDCTVPVTQVSGQESGEFFTVDQEDMALIDAGAYTHQFLFDIGSYVGAGEEIPEGGVRIYAKAWIEEPIDPADDKSEMDTIIEFNQSDNRKSILFESLLSVYRAPVTISKEQTNEAGGTEARIMVRNNSLVNTSTGNLIVSLVDDSGRVLESQQCYDPREADQGLITLEGEQTATRVFRFDQKGASVEVSYTNAVLDQENNANLASLSLKGIPFSLESGKTEYKVSVKDMTSTFVSAATEDPNATVTVNGIRTDLGNIPFNLNYGSNTINIKVTAADGVTVKNYKVVVINTKEDDKSSDDSQRGEAYRYITDEMFAGLIKDADGVRILIEASGTGHEEKFVFDLSPNGLTRLAGSGLALGLRTPILDLVLDPSAIADIANQNAGQISIVIEIIDGNISISILINGEKLKTVNGKIIASLYVEDACSGTVAEILNDDGTTSIIKLSSARDGILTVPLNGSAVFRAYDNAMDFNDIGDHWAKNYIDFVTSRNLFLGTGENRFSPSTGMTRGMLVTVLGRLSDIITEAYDGQSFGDVDPNVYYARYIEWAAINGIVKGDGRGSFLPDQDVTREQLAVILYNCIRFMGFDLIEKNSKDHSFVDADDISDYAREAVNALYRAGVISGKTGNLFDPKGTATRAEVAVMIEKLITSISW